MPYDELLGDPDAHRFRAELARGEWREFHDFLAGLADPDDRAFYLTSLARFDGRPEWADAWVSARPSSALPLLFRGLHSAHLGWQARGGGRAATVPDQAWPVFFSLLVAADRDLSRAAALDGDDPVPHAASLWPSMGLELGLAESRRRFTEATRRSGQDRLAHSLMIEVTSRRWQGSADEVLAFARSACERAPEGSNLHRLIALAHIERALAHPSGVAGMHAYFSAPGIRQEVSAAAARSIGSPRYIAGPFSWADRNVFALCSWLMADHAGARAEMELPGFVVHRDPWRLLGDPAAVAARARRECGARPAGPAVTR